MSSKRAVLCDPCKARARTIDAVFWCPFCTEAFCKLCCQFHQTMKMTKTHKVQKIEEVSQEKLKTSKNQVQDLSPADFTEKTQLKELDNLLLNLDNMSDTALHLKKMNFDCKMKNESRKVDVMRKVNIFKNRLKELADRFEKHINGELDQLHGGENTVIDARIEECETIFNSIEMSKDLTQSLKIDDINSATLTKVNAARHRCAEFKSALQRVHSKMQLIQYNLVIDRNLAEAMDFSPSVIGKIDIAHDDGMDIVTDGVGPLPRPVEKPNSSRPTSSSSNTFQPADVAVRSTLHMAQADKLYEIYLQKKEDLDENMLTSIRALGDGNYLTLDRNNDKLLLYRPDGTLLIQYVFTSQAWDMTLVDLKTAAVTLPDNEKIVLVKLRESALCAERVIKTQDHCYGICAITNYLVVTVKGGFVKILTKAGEEIACLRYNDRGEILFVDPQYVATNATETELYVTDFKRQTVTALKLSGIKIDPTPKFVYTNSELQNPAGLHVDSQGNLYVCGFASHNIHQISPEGQLIKVILQKIINPQTACMSKSEDRLLVSSLYSDAKSKHVENVIEVFKLV